MTIGGVLRRFRPILIDGVGPIVAYFGLRALGVADLPALLAGGGIAAADAVVSALIERRVRLLPIYVCGMFIFTGSLAFLTHDARVVLLKPSIASAGIGLYLISLAARRSALTAALAPLIERGSEERAARWRLAWATQPALPRRMSLACLIAGLLLLAESAARTVIVFRFSIGQSLFLAHAPAVIVVVALVAIARFWVQPAVVRAMAAAAADGAEPAKSTVNG